MAQEATHGEHHELHIFVNRRRFGPAEGVRPRMTGAQIAALVDVPADNAVVRIERDMREVPINDPVEIRNDEHFLVTRRVVEGGHVARTH
jgi:hypothetical protein